MTAWRTLVGDLGYLLRRLWPFAVAFALLQTAVRLTLAASEEEAVVHGAGDWVRILLTGLGFDAATFTYFALPMLAYLLLLPRGYHLSRVDRLLTAILFALWLFVLSVAGVSEWLFWNDLGVRFNFVAVDYLVYTHEVLANIWQSYPIAALLAAVALPTALASWAMRRYLVPATFCVSTWSRRLAAIAVLALTPVGVFAMVDSPNTEISANQHANELAMNGLYSLFSAFRNNELDYQRIYMTGYRDHPLPKIRDILSEPELGQVFTGSDPNDITRFVPGDPAAPRRNVVLVVMESMSAEFMAHFGGDPSLTPNLDRLAEQSLFFERAYATGTRTVRGLEAVTLSVPPLPGRSIIKRPDNGNLSSIGFVFRDRGYDTRFLYGGYGYFDNMNAFFGQNGFDIVDRSDFSDDEQTFANAWGLCDEDLYAKAIKEARQSYEAGRPFMHLVMTASNHRPYTFPAGRPGIPGEGGGRAAGVRYADYALGRFLAAAEKEPWFRDTLFVFVADHTHGSAGKQELTVEKHHIPLMVYAPDLIAPRKIGKLVSQIDVAPILLGRLGFPYQSRFYGEDVVADHDERPHAYVANYQRLGFLSDDALMILKPGRRYADYRRGRPVPEGNVDVAMLLHSIAIYKHAADWRRHLARVDTLATPDVPDS